MKKKKNKTVKKGNGFKEHLVFLLIALTLIFLTSSFVVENVYNYADRIATTPEGVAEVYEMNIGQRAKPEAVPQVTETPTEDSQPENTGEPSGQPEAPGTGSNQ